MNTQESKCVIILDETMPIGIMANTAAILAISLGKINPEIVGENAVDAEGNTYIGLIQFPVPVLKASSNKLKELRMMLYQPDYTEIVTVDFSNVSQESMTYTEFLTKTKASSSDDLSYMGLALVGAKKKINKLTGS